MHGTPLLNLPHAKRVVKKNKTKTTNLNSVQLKLNTNNKRDKHDEGTLGAGNLPDAMIPCPTVTACDVVTLRFSPCGSILRQEGKGPGGAFHLSFRSASQPSRAPKRLTGRPQHRNSRFWQFHKCTKPLQCFLQVAARCILARLLFRRHVGVEIMESEKRGYACNLEPFSVTAA